MFERVEMPDLGLIAFRVDDDGDHHGAGHWVSLSRTESDATAELVDQYLSALGHLAKTAADSPDDGWALTRPLLFYAHHTAELAVKTVLLAADVPLERRHGLVNLWQKIANAGLPGAVEAVDPGWCQSFVSVMADVAGNSMGARDAKPNEGYPAIDDVWCCVNPAVLFAASESFAVQCLALAESAGAAAKTGQEGSPRYPCACAA